MTVDPVIVRVGEASVVQLSGEIDLALADPVQRAVLAHVGDGPALILDLTEVTFLDSAGVRMLDEVVDACANRDVRLQVVAPPNGAVRFTLFICAFPEELLGDTVAGALTRLAVDVPDAEPPSAPLSAPSKDDTQPL